MPNMSLGAYTFDSNPSEIDDLIKSVNRSAHVLTYTSVARFNWGASIIGKPIQMDWDYMTATQYDAIHALWLAGAQIVFDPQDGSSKTYNVTIENLKGKYHLTPDDDIGGEVAYRTSVVLTLLVISEVA